MPNTLINMAREILAIEADLPCRLDYRDNQRPTLDNLDLYMFQQVWGSTVLGFGGIGGRAMTTANTYVFAPQIPEQKCFVYFAGRFAYAADYTEAFKEDLRNQNMASVSRSGKYLKK